MQCNVYNTELSRVGVIETWVSMVWEETYNGEGSFQLELQQREEIIDILKLDYYCGMLGHNTLMVIKSIEIQNGTIVVNGFSAVRVLQDRVSTTVISNQNAESAMRRLVSEMTHYPCVELGDDAGLTDIFSQQVSDATVYDYCATIAEGVDMGFRLRHDKKSRKLLFECYKPSANPNLRYSTSYGNMGDLNYSISTNDYKNVAVVAGAGEGNNRVTVYAGDTEATGVNRRELYVDARQEQPEDGEDDADYRARLVRIGEEKLIEQAKVESIKFTLDDDRVQLGDIVSCTIREIGVQVQARIVGITEMSEGNQTTREASIGSPIKIRRR